MEFKKFKDGLEERRKVLNPIEEEFIKFIRLKNRNKVLLSKTEKEIEGSISTSNNSRWTPPKSNS